MHYGVVLGVASMTDRRSGCNTGACMLQPPAWSIGRAQRALAYGVVLRAAGLATTAKLDAAAESGWTVAELHRKGDVALVRHRVQIVASRVDALTAAPDRHAAWLAACDGADWPGVRDLPPVLQLCAAAVAVLLAVGPDVAVPWELNALASAVAAAYDAGLAGRASLALTPLTPLTPRRAIQVVACWRTALFSVALLAQALELTDAQQPGVAGALPLVDAAMLVRDDQLFDALERARRGGRAAPAAGGEGSVGAQFRAIVAQAVAAQQPAVGRKSASPAPAPARTRPGKASNKADSPAPHLNPFTLLSDGCAF